MILSGKSVISRGTPHTLLSPAQQIQPSGVDLSLQRVMRWVDAGIIDFDDTSRKALTTQEILFTVDEKRSTIHVRTGAYLIEFNEEVATPLDVMGQIFVRSSLFRSGATVSADAGYDGAIGAMLQVRVVIELWQSNHDSMSISQIRNLWDFVC